MHKGFLRIVLLTIGGFLLILISSITIVQQDFVVSSPVDQNLNMANACDPSYPDFCIPPPPPDLDCTDISRRSFKVLGEDPHNFDSDGDGIGCSPVFQKVSILAILFGVVIELTAMALFSNYREQSSENLLMEATASYKGTPNKITRWFSKQYRRVEDFWSKTKTLLLSEKWYQKPDTIDPGFIEVSLAVSAIIIALPSLSNFSYLEPPFLVLLKIIYFIVVAISTWTSITLINLYANGKSKDNDYILFSPVKNGPFFTLSWTIIFGFILISLVLLG